MPAVQVRDFPQDVYDRIKQEAKESGRSIMQQTKHIVMQHFEQTSSPASLLSDAAPPQVAPTAANAFRTDAERNPFFHDSTAEVELRRLRREELFARIATRNYPKAALQLDSAQLVREARDER